MGRFAEKLGERNFQSGSKRNELVVSQSDRAALPLRIRALGDAQLLGELSLRKAGGFAEGVETLAERRAGIFGGTAGLHGRSIRPIPAS